MNYRLTKMMTGWIDTYLAADDKRRRELAEGLERKYRLMQDNLQESWGTYESNTEYFTHVFNTLRLINQGSRPQEKRLESLKKYAAWLEKRCPKIKIVFLVQEFSLWPSFQTVWERYSAMENVECRLVVSYDWEYTRVPQGHYFKMIKDYRDAGLPAEQGNFFSLIKECPDMVFYMKPYERRRSNIYKLLVENVMKYVPYTVFISYCLDVQGGQKLFRFFYQMPAFYHMWRIIGYSRFYVRMMTERGFRNGENVRFMGHPKFDLSYRMAHGEFLRHEEWDEIIGDRRVVLWNSHFSINPGEGVGTFMRWAEPLCDYFENHPDMVLLWRPHPVFWEMRDKAAGTFRREVDRLVARLKELPNCITDATADYRYAFCASDAMISDATTFLMEYRASGNPILFTPKVDGEDAINPAYTEGLPQALADRDLEAWLEEVRSNGSAVDPRSAEVFRQEVGECDGHIGERIADQMLKDMNDDIASRVTEEVLP